MQTENKNLELGQTVMTQGIAVAGNANEDFKSFILLSLHKHKKCDWGDITQEDKDENQFAYEIGERIMSAYNIPEEIEMRGKETKIWIITERDRSLTTTLFPREY